MGKRLLLIDDDEELLKLTEKCFTKNGYDVITAKSGEEGIAKHRVLAPDVTVIEMLLSGVDGQEVLESIDKKNGKIIAVSAVKNEALCERALSSGADYFMLKPFTPASLLHRVEGLVSSPRYDAKKAALEKRLSEIFITVGIPAHIKGYQFLREAIKRAIDSPEIINSITKRLYPEVAERFATSPSKVERAIRHAIEVAWNKGRIESINSLFGLKVYSSNEKPTNGEFIALVADKMMLESI